MIFVVFVFCGCTHMCFCCSIQCVRFYILNYLVMFSFELICFVDLIHIYFICFNNMVVGIGVFLRFFSMRHMLIFVGAFLLFF